MLCIFGGTAILPEYRTSENVIFDEVNEDSTNSLLDSGYIYSGFEGAYVDKGYFT